MARELLSVKNDYVFKGIFGNPKNVSALTDFLKSVLDIPESEFDRLEFGDPHLQRRHENDKLGILDVKVFTVSGKVVDVEIQILPEVGMKERIVFYVCRLLSDQAVKGGDYASLRKVISIIITDFQLIDDSVRYHNRYRLHDSETGSTFTDLLEINTLELPKLPAESDQSALWDWLRFIKVEKESEMEALARKNPQIKKAVGALRIMSADERERERALNHQRDLMAAHGRLEYAKAEGIEIGKSEGIEIGKSEGIEIGKSEGIEIGEQRGERAKAVAVARKLKEKGLPPGEIAEISGLPADEIERL